MNQEVKTPKELMKKLELYSVPAKDIKGNIDYFMISSSLYKEIWWGLLKLQKQMDNEVVNRNIKDGMAEVVRCKDCIYQDGKDGQCPVQSTGDPFYDSKPDDNWF